MSTMYYVHVLVLYYTTVLDLYKESQSVGGGGGGVRKLGNEIKLKVRTEMGCGGDKSINCSPTSQTNKIKIYL